MKKLCVLFFMSQIICATVQDTINISEYNVRGSSRRSKPLSRREKNPVVSNKNSNKFSGTKPFTFPDKEITQAKGKTPEQPKQVKVRVANRTSQAQDTARKQRQEKTTDESVIDVADQSGVSKEGSILLFEDRRRTVKSEITADQQAKMQNIKKGLNKLNEDSLVRNVFKQLDMHTDFQKIMDSLANKVDSQITQSDLNSIQNFLNMLVDKKDLIQSLDTSVVSQFVTRFASVLKENFSELSPKELVEFFDQVFTLTSKALNSQGARVTTKKDDKRPVVNMQGSSSGSRQVMGKGGFSSQFEDVYGFMMGLCFTVGIIALIDKLANQDS